MMSPVDKLGTIGGQASLALRFLTFREVAGMQNPEEIVKFEL